MGGSSFGKIFKITTWGESHGSALGVVVDGCPSGVKINEKYIQKVLNMRKPGNSEFVSTRKEDDKVTILSGVFEQITTGAPICLIIFNKDQKIKEYDNMKNIYRPGHADYTYDMKYGIRDHRGGGRSSGRETVTRVAAGAIAKKILSDLGINSIAYTSSIGNINIASHKINKKYLENNDLRLPNNLCYLKIKEYLKKCIEDNNSIGGMVTCKVLGLKPGIGQPCFDKLDALISKAIFSIGGVKAVEIGLGFKSSKILGSENNDIFYSNKKGRIKKYTNNSGGILGGITDGSEIVIKVAFKPTPSISKVQKTINKNKQNVYVQIKGRHDPTIVIRAVAVVEAMVNIVIVDSLMQNLVTKMSNIKKFYKNTKF